MDKFKIFVIAGLVCALSFAGLSPKEVWGPLPAVPTPRDNPTTKPKVELGKQLFFDPRLSLDGTVSCNSCHNVMGSGTDNRPTSVGIGGKKGGRCSPTVWNAAYHPVQFWDGRAATLEEQAKGPMVNPVEMGMPDHKVVIQRIKNIEGYQQSFKAVFGGADPITIDNTAKAIAAYERTLVTPKSAFDRYLKGDRRALSSGAVRGMQLVMDLGCITCHNGPNFNGPIGNEVQYQRFPTFPDNPYVAKYKLMDDKGRGDHTKNEDDDHFWRIPTWRNIAVTAPYFHNGSVPTLEEAVRVMAKSQLDRDLSNAQVGDIVAFLSSLTGEFPRQELPRLPDTPGRTLVD